jgi:hypothetical protein
MKDEFFSLRVPTFDDSLSGQKRDKTKSKRVRVRAISEFFSPIAIAKN